MRRPSAQLLACQRTPAVAHYCTGNRVHAHTRGPRDLCTTSRQTDQPQKDSMYTHVRLPGRLARRARARAARADAAGGARRAPLAAGVHRTHRGAGGHATARLRGVVACMTRAGVLPSTCWRPVTWWKGVRFGFRFGYLVRARTGWLCFSDVSRLLLRLLRFLCFSLVSSVVSVIRHEGCEPEQSCKAQTQSR